MAGNSVTYLDDQTALLPGQMVLMTSVNLPAVSRAELQQAIPFALEEKLAQEVEQCFFAVGDTSADGETPVAVLDQPGFEELLEKMRIDRPSIEKLLPDYLALPYQANTWTVWRHDEWVSVRTGVCSGFCVESVNFEVLCSFYGDKKPPQCLEYTGDFDAGAPINLLQGRYRLKTAAQGLPLMGRWALYAVTSVILSIFTAQGIQYVYFQNASKQLNQAITTLYHRLLPSVSMGLNPKSQIQSLLYRLQRSQKMDALLALLGKIGLSLSKQDDLKLTHLSYRHSHWQLTVESKQEKSLKRFLKELSQDTSLTQRHDFNPRAHQLTVNLEIGLK